MTFSYDDGVREDLKLCEIINRYGIKCTFNYTNWENMTHDEVTENVLSKGHEIAVHGAQHRAEGVQRPIEAIDDVLSCRKELESRYGRIIRGMAYPDSGIRNITTGMTYERIRHYLKDLDIAYVRTLAGDNNRFRLPEDWYAWMPTAHHENPALMDYIDEFLSLDLSSMYISGRFPRLFYLWGHSYEFERNGNWDRLETICEKLGGNKDIWYATNMEIYEYVEAFRNLIRSADGKMIYNPALFTVWFDVDGKPYSVKSGETITLE